MLTKRSFLLFTILLLVTLALLALDSDKGASGPDVYAAAVTLNWQADPTVNELLNTTGSSIAVTRITAGQYRIESNPPAFTVGRTLYQTHHYVMGPSATIQITMQCAVVTYCNLYVYHADPFGNSLYFYDGGTAGLAIPIKIEVYP